MTNILVPQHSVIAGVSGQNQSGIARELIFDAITSGKRPTLIAFVDVPHDDAIRDQFSIWCRARKRTFNKSQVVVTDAIHSAKDDDHFFAKVDLSWKLRPSPSPIFYRDLSGVPVVRDRWISFAPELAAMYRSPVLTCANLGPHVLASSPIQDIEADAHWECTDYGAQVRLKHIESGEALQFTPKAVHGGRVWNVETQENNHAA